MACYRKKEFRAAARAEAERYSWAEATQALTGVYSEVLQHSAKKA